LFETPARPARIPILYLILGVLILVSVAPMYFYSRQMISSNRDRLKTNEMLLQNTITQSLGGDIAQRQSTVRLMLANLASAITISSGGDLGGNHVHTPEMRALLENFVSSSDELAYATLVNLDAKGISAGRISPDAFLQRELERAYSAAREGRIYNGDGMVLGEGKDSRTIMLVSTPVAPGGHFAGMLAVAVDLSHLIRRMRDVSTGGLTTYVVDQRGRLVAGAGTDYFTGQDMTNLEIVRNFVEQGGKAQFVATREFRISDGRQTTEMLGTYSPVPSLAWAVIAQKPQREAYRSVFEMQRTAGLLALLLVLLSIAISSFAARKITNPLEILTESSSAIARGDFSKRLNLNSRTEIGELAGTFNIMTQELEQFVADLKRAAEENRALFLNSIQMLAGAVDEKDPYTRGHSDRVTRYSVLLATELGLPEDFIEKIRISAQLHDVGKIGIEDRVLKKPGALTPEEFEIMKTHTTKGANILRPVQQLQEMLPGIELHHESLDGRGYPYGLKGDAIPLMARIIAVADTFDAITTNRPYQAAHDAAYAVRIINNLAGKRLDPVVVVALTSLFGRGELQTRMTPAAAPTLAALHAEAEVPPEVVEAVETGRV
jgi:HD-GYP domain-containing protein (c-di-GMP phosphodiesterase class II)